MTDGKEGSNVTWLRLLRSGALVGVLLGLAGTSVACTLPTLPRIPEQPPEDDDTDEDDEDTDSQGFLELRDTPVYV